MTTTTPSTKLRVRRPPSGKKNWSTTAAAVIASDPPIQIGDSTH